MLKTLSLYAEPLGTAAGLFPLVVGATLVPFALWHYRRHGRVHPWRALVSYSFVFYLMAACFLVTLPLPDRPAPDQVAAWVDAHARTAEPRLDPLGFATDLLTLGPGTTKNRAILQAAFNGILLLPLGFYLVYAFRWRWVAAWAGGWLVSLVFEVSQLTGLFGWYPAPYRLFDAGDLVLNSTGALLGAVGASALLKAGLLRPLDALAPPDVPWIGVWRRSLALGLDAALGLTLGLMVLPPWWWVGLAITLVGLPAVDPGQGFGRRMTLCGLRTAKRRKTGRLRILVRQTVLWGPFFLAAGLDQPLVQAGCLLIGTVGLTVHGLGSISHGEKAGWVDRWLGLRTVNTWTSPRESRPRRVQKGK